jgi:hypothetical protein
MRRNDGDAVSQHAEHVGKAFACRRAAMQFSQHIARDQHIAREVRTTMSERKSDLRYRAFKVPIAGADETS